MQQVAIALIDFRFDDTRSNGASKTTVLTAIVDRQLAMLRRSEIRQRQRVERFASNCELSYEPTQRSDAVDAVRSAIRDLSATDRRICGLLIDGHSTNEIAARCDVSWHTANSAIERIRRHLEQCGLRQFEEAI